MAATRQGKLLKKRPTLKTLNSKQLKSTFYVKSQTPYLSALKRTKKMLAKLPQGQQYVTLYAMGKAVTKGLSLACYFQQRSYRVSVLTKTVEVIDELIEEDEQADTDDVDTTLAVRKLSGVEIRVHRV